MNNRIVAGRFSGKRIKMKNGVIYIPINGDKLELTSEIVDHVIILGTIHNKSFLSGLLRGLPAKSFGETAWLSAMQSARNKYAYNIKIVYRDRSASVVIACQAIMQNLAARYEAT